jgi:hypothetical protein
LNCQAVNCSSFKAGIDRSDPRYALPAPKPARGECAPFIWNNRLRARVLQQPGKHRQQPQSRNRIIVIPTGIDNRDTPLLHSAEAGPDRAAHKLCNKRARGLIRRNEKKYAVACKSLLGQNAEQKPFVICAKDFCSVVQQTLTKRIRIRRFNNKPFHMLAAHKLARLAILLRLKDDVEIVMLIRVKLILANMQL